MNSTEEAIYQQLKLLSHQRILDFIPARKTPVIIFETERIDKNRIHISAANYQHRKVKYQSQVDSVLDYASNNQYCRSVTLLEYFGQYGSEPCGFCDVCTGEHESGISFSDFIRTSDKIKQLLQTQSYSIDQMIKMINEPEAGIIKVSRWLLDNGILKSGSNGLLTYTTKSQ